MEFKTIRKASAPEMVAEQILNQIEAGELPPGSCLPAQRDLARLLGVGRSSIREAINALIVMGYLEAVQGKGTYVRQPLPQAGSRMERLEAAFQAGSIFDLMEARQLLESRSAAVAAQRADKAKIRKLKKSIASLDAQEEDYAVFLKSDIAFHQAVSEATGNVVICEMTHLILEKLSQHHAKLRTRRLSTQYRDQSKATAARVVECIERQDEKNAAKWMERHLNVITEELKNIID